LVIGGGPAGIAAATAAAENGKSVALLDDNRRPGGQIWREHSVAHAGAASRNPQKSAALERLQRAGVRQLLGYTVFNASASSYIEATHESGTALGVVQVSYSQLIMATGARERFLPFPGWTLPGVFGAGGLQALVRSGYPIAGKRVVVAGTGPLLLAVAAHLVEEGAIVSAVLEQAPMSKLASFAASLWRKPAKLMQGAGHRTTLRSATYRTGSWVSEAIAAAEGSTLSAVRVTDGKRTWTERCDLLASGYHLVPNTELAELLGCTFRGGYVEVDAQQRTSVQNVFCAGEPTGIAGLDAALIQGEIAGLACAGVNTDHLVRGADRERAFGVRLEQAFALRDELRKPPGPSTIICRCEDATLADVQKHSGWSDAKLQTRCGMGPCQGRVCGPAIEFLLGWKPASVRQPIFPVPLSALSSAAETEPSAATTNT
jgi:NADPH-dependent 2,4-dienoyl-CoA reductase/sulfur reductase-like enzyme